METKIYDELPNQKDKSLFADLVAEFKAQEAKNRRKRPYVLFGFLALDWKGGIKRYTPQLHKLFVGGAHVNKLNYYIRRGMIILDYWLPTKADIPRKQAQTEHGWILDVRNGEADGKFYELEMAIKAHMGQVGELYEAQQRENALRAKLEAAEAKLKGGGRG